MMTVQEFAESKLGQSFDYEGQEVTIIGWVSEYWDKPFDWHGARTYLVAWPNRQSPYTLIGEKPVQHTAEVYLSEIDKFQDNVESVSQEFSAIVRRELADHLVEINRLNKTDEYSGGACATHNYCDANELMNEAFEEMLEVDFEFGNDDHVSIWNAAWKRSKDNLFK